LALRPGQIGVGSNAGSNFKLYGTGYVRKLELLQEAGMAPDLTLPPVTKRRLWGDERGTLISVRAPLSPQRSVAQSVSPTPE